MVEMQPGMASTVFIPCILSFQYLIVVLIEFLLMLHTLRIKHCVIIGDGYFNCLLWLRSCAQDGFSLLKQLPSNDEMVNYITSYPTF